MACHIPAYIEERIRRPPPQDALIVPGSTPVVAFGNSQTACVATLGINPSRREFRDTDGDELRGENRRLATHSSLGTDDLTNASAEVITTVLTECDEYFRRKPYWAWFRQLEPIVNAAGGSYRDGTACHLDLVQWATDPTWGQIQPAHVRRRLLADDGPFLVEQLRRENLKFLLVNGRGALRQLQSLLAIEFDEVEPIVGMAHQDTKVYRGTFGNELKVLSWSTNIQSSHGVTKEVREEIRRRVTQSI